MSFPANGHDVHTMTEAFQLAYQPSAYLEAFVNTSLSVPSACHLLYESIGYMHASHVGVHEPCHAGGFEEHDAGHDWDVQVLHLAHEILESSGIVHRLGLKELGTSLDLLLHLHDLRA